MKRFPCTMTCLMAFLLAGCHLPHTKAQLRPACRPDSEARDTTPEPPPGPPLGDESPDTGVIMRRIAQVKSCPKVSDREDYGEDAWSYLIGLAHDLQRVHPIILEAVFRDYCLHYQTAFEEGVDETAEWSKVLLLLRVMFVLPESEDVKDWPPHGFGFAKKGEYTGVPTTVAAPIRWIEGKPKMVASLSTYFGPPYDGGAEYRFFLGSFRYRDLRRLVARPDSSEDSSHR